jgi:hypothetical protein
MTRFVLAAVLALTLAAPASAAVAPQPPLDRNVLKALWQPIGFFKPGDPIPAPDAPPTPTSGALYNPSGHFSAYDTNVYESLNFPGRQAGDTTNNDRPGAGMPAYGFCPPHPQYMPQGRCTNHALEYLDYYEATMKELLEDFGGTVHRYEFENPGRSDVDGAVGEPAGLSSPGGITYNIAGIVPGADNPEEEVIVAGHWDFTDAAHAAAWDSSEGHAEVIRIAKIMTDYWRATGTRPSATVKFMPWAAEESGTYGSQDYVNRHIVEGEGRRIRGYFNLDPCAGAYPAFYHGNPAEQVPMVLQLADPSGGGVEDPERITAFNEKAVKLVDEFWADIDDTVETAAGEAPVFTDADRDRIVTAVGGLLLFSSDYANFEAIGVPIFNLFPDMFGPHADGTPASSEGVATIHTPRDNLQTLNALTGRDQTGLTASDGWMTGMELCAHLEGRYMLQPEMGGAQTANPDPVAYFEPLPYRNAYPKGKLMTFDAAGSYQYSQVATRRYLPDADLQFKWDFGDGSPAAFGKTVRHAYARENTYKVTLTVTNRDTHVSDTMSTNVAIAEGNGNDADPSRQTSDPGLRAKGAVVACQSAWQTGFQSLRVRPSGKGLRIDGQVTGGGGFLADVFRAAKGRRVGRAKRVASFTVNGSTRWNGRGATARGYYFIRLTTRGMGSRPDVRAFGLRRGAKRFRLLRRFQRPDSCEAVSLFRLESPVFGGKRKLGVAFTLTESGAAVVDLVRGSKRVKRYRRNATPNRLQKVRISPRGLRRGQYKVVLRAGGKRETLYATRL